MPSAGLGLQLAEALHLEPRAFQQAAELIAGEAEPPMRRLLAQELKLMRREIDHQQLAAGREHARGFGDRRGRIVEEVQHLMQHHRVGGTVGQRHVIEIAVAHLRMGEPGALELHARIGQHVVIEIEAERLLRAGAEQFEDAPGAGAEIDQEIERPLAPAPRPWRPRPGSRPHGARGC